MRVVIVRWMLVMGEPAKVTEDGRRMRQSRRKGNHRLVAEAAVYAGTDQA